MLVAAKLEKVEETRPKGLSLYQSMGDIEVIFSSVSLICRDYQITQRINNVSVATLRFNKSDFIGLGAINYLDDVIINSVRTKERVFAGNVVSIQEEPNNQVLISLVLGVELIETGIRALTVASVEHQEVFYSMARMGGFPSDKLHIHGLSSSDKQMTAFVPFKGLLIEEDETIDDVQFLNRKSLLEKLPKTVESEKWNGLLDADGWISFHCTAPHFFEAESLAIEKADVFLAAYSGLLQYGYSVFDGHFIEWERTREAINLKRQNHISLVVPATGAVWLRDLFPYKPSQTKLRPTISINVEEVISASKNFYLPLLIWNRFRDSEDYYVVTIGLWQVFELFTSGNKLPKRALMVKFQEHLDTIGLTLTEHERELLRLFREIRNDIEHGRKPNEPSIQEIKRVKALTNRIILSSLKQAKAQ